MKSDWLGLSEIYKNRHLLLSSIRNELRAKYAGHILGYWWLILSPLFLIGIYAVVYGAIFQLQPTHMDRMQYILYIFSGLVPFLSVAESLNAGVTSITNNVAILKNISFPAVIIPIKTTILSHLSFVFGIMIILLMDGFLSKITPHVFLIPVFLILQVMFLSGISFVLSLMNIIIKDTSNFITYIVMLIMIASPIAYTRDMVPDRFLLLIKLNPFAYFFELYQSVISLNEMPKTETFLIVFFMSVGLFILGEVIFSRARRIILNYV